jgi:peroxiredoxin
MSVAARVTVDRVLNVLLLVAVVYGIAAVRPTSQPKPTTYQSGETVSAITGVPYAAAKRTAVLFIRSTCHYCTESMPFYQDLMKGGARLVAISGEPQESLNAYLDEHGLSIESATVERASWPKLTGTPTLLIVDDTGRVVKSWIGLLSAPDQQAVRELLQ